MSLMRELELVSYDIEQLWIEGRNPVEIAGELDCHIDLVDAWMELNNLGAKEEDSDQPLYIGLRSTEEIQDLQT